MQLSAIPDAAADLHSFTTFLNKFFHKLFLRLLDWGVNNLANWEFAPSSIQATLLSNSTLVSSSDEFASYRNVHGTPLGGTRHPHDQHQSLGHHKRQQ